MKDYMKKELKELVSNEKEPETHDAKIFYDKKQYTIRIPSKFAKGSEIDTKKDVFEFKLIIPDLKDTDTRPKIIGRLKRG